MAALMRLLARSGLVITSPFHPARSYRRPSVGDAARDYISIGKDMRSIGRDLKKSAIQELRKHGEQTH